VRQRQSIVWSIYPQEAGRVEGEGVCEGACHAEDKDGRRRYIQITDAGMQFLKQWEAVERKWVGLDGEIPGLGLVTEEFYNGMLFAEDILKEKNT
jgi:DNA-binding PadR family transcriptional regulator